MNAYLDEILLMELIRDYAFGTPKYIYRNVMLEFKDTFSHPMCDGNCRWRPMLSGFGFPILKPLILTRSTHATCMLCTNALSDYSHTVCHECANWRYFPVEFEYHHRNCGREDGLIRGI